MSRINNLLQARQRFERPVTSWSDQAGRAGVVERMPSAAHYSPVAATLRSVALYPRQGVKRPSHAPLHSFGTIAALRAD